MGEFELIDRYFKRVSRHADVGIGDDCAVWSPSQGHQMAFSADMLVEGRHFLPTVNPLHLGHKSLAVNLSDLAACGASPRAFLLSLSLPRVDEVWLSAFSRGLFVLADAQGCDLIGGDTTQGPLNIAITVIGEIPVGQAILRAGARPFDDLYVSGNLGDARLALEVFRGHLSLPQCVFDVARQRMDLPTPRVDLGIALRGVASSMADVSDGLLGDLSHVLKSSAVGARIDLAALTGLMLADSLWDCPRGVWLRCVLSGGDDYELVFTAPPSLRDQVSAASHLSNTPVTRIGTITAEPDLLLIAPDGTPQSHSFSSFDHFA